MAAAAYLWGRDRQVTLLVEDRALLDSFRRGEDRAIERVYGEYVGQVTALLRNGFSFMSGGHSTYFKGYKDAWELECAVQDVFIQAFSPRARESYDGIKPFGPYLMTIARNRVISLLRSETRELRRRSMLAAEGPPPGPESPEKQAIEQQLTETVQQFRDTLDAELSEFFTRRYGEDRNLMETARMLGLTRMKARIRDRKLRKAFVDFLRRKGMLSSSGGLKSSLMLMVLAMLVKP